MKQIVRTLVVLALVWIAVVLSGALPRARPGQREALALMQQPAPALGSRNAYAALWLSSWDVPPAEQQAVMRADIEAWAAYRDGASHKQAFVSTAAAHYPAVARPSATEAGLCHTWAEGCLAQVRKDPAAARAALAPYAALARIGQDLAQYDHVASRIPPSFDSPLPPLQGFAAVATTAAALKAADGDAAGALADVCRFGRTWRTLRAHTDLLILDMVGVAYLSSAAQLAGEIVAESPQAWDADCDAAFAPLADAELDQCAEMRGEFHGLDDALAHAGSMGGDEGAASAPARWLTRHFMNTRRTLGGLAQGYARHCDASAAAFRASRLPMASPQPNDIVCGRMDWVFDPVGCSIQSAGMADLSPYYNRILDLDARLRTLGTARWLRTQSDRAAALPQRPDVLRTPRQPMALSADGQRLEVTLLDPNPTRHQWSVPLPAPAANAGADAPAAR